MRAIRRAPIATATEATWSVGEGVGAGWFLKLPNGGMGIIDRRAIDLDHYEKWVPDYKPAAQDPLFEVVEKNMEMRKKPQQITFRWRIRAEGATINFIYIYLPLNPNLPPAAIRGSRTSTIQKPATWRLATRGLSKLQGLPR